jgi:hypothetical protein
MIIPACDVLKKDRDPALRDARPPILGKPAIGALAPQGEVATITTLILRSRAQRGVSKDARRAARGEAA